MSKRKWPVGSFVPCSPRHLHCSPAHAEFVRNYRIERHRQEVMYEAQLDPRNTGEYQHWRENGGTIVTFKSWLIAHKGSGLQWQKEAYERDSDIHGRGMQAVQTGFGQAVQATERSDLQVGTQDSSREFCDSGTGRLRAWVNECIGAIT